MTSSVFVDLEIHPETQKLLKIGAWRADDKASFYRHSNLAQKTVQTDALRQLLDFIGQPRFIIGHNIEHHDWPYLCENDQAFSELTP